MRLFRRWLRRLRGLLVLARRRILGLPPLFDDVSIAGDAAAPPKPPRGPAPRRGYHRSGRTVSGRSYFDRFGRHGDSADHPVIEQLRRRAVNELFEWLGIILIPRQTWPILKRVGDPGAAVEHLILALGCDPERARRRDADEIARLQAAIDILVALDILRPYLSLEHLQEIEYLLFSGDYDTVRKYSRIVSALSAVLIGREKSGSLRVFAVYEAFIADIERYVRDPLSLEADDADEALRMSDDFITAMEKYTALYEDVSGMISAVHAAWPDDLESGDDFRLREGMDLHFKEIDATLLSEPTLDLTQIEELIEECSELFKDLEGLLHRIHDAPRPDGAAQTSEKDDALVFFGFAAGSAPSWDEIKRAFRAIIKKVHPDHATGITDPEEIARRHKLTQKAIRYCDELRRHADAA